jgi:hypothetical protein
MKYIGVFLSFLFLNTVAQKPVTLNQKDDGFRGIWYHIGKTSNEYVHKYSGGLGTYPANHYPFSVYSKAVDKTFFCYGGSSKEENPSLLHEVAFFDHKTQTVSRPTIVLDKKTDDAHDNPVISLDKTGYIWLFSTSHGVERPSYIHKSSAPFSIDKFELVNATYQKEDKRVPFDNFSYLQMYYDAENGFFGLMTHYEKDVLKYKKNKPRRTIGYVTSKDGKTWSKINDLGKIQEGHYQSSGVKRLKDGRLKITSVFNYHPDTKDRAGLDFRTNIYYLETTDFGKTWQNSFGEGVEVPLASVQNNALVLDAQKQGKLTYINDIAFDDAGNPMISYIESTGPNPGSDQGPHLFKTIQSIDQKWQVKTVAQVDHNYDYGSLYFDDGTWRIIAPTGNQPFNYNNGGEIEIWELSNASTNWKRKKKLTTNSKMNHSYPRKPVDYHDGFYAFWADGHPRQSSASHLYFSNKKGNVFQLPYKFNGETFKPRRIIYSTRNKNEKD